MTEKRFTYEYDEYNGNLFDNKMNTFYPIEDSEENIEILCDRLNELVEGNEEEKFKEDYLQIATNELKKLQDENEQLKGAVAYYELLLMSLEKKAKRISSIRSFKND